MNQDMGMERLISDYREMRAMVSENVLIRSIDKPAGSMALIEITVKAPTYYITGPGDASPKATNEIKFYIDVKEGFPRTKPHVYYEQGKILASINTFRGGSQCIDDWIYDPEHAGNNSTLGGTMVKTIMAIIHDSSVENYKSMANSDLADWQKNKTKSGEFPSCALNTLIKPENSRESKRPGLPPKVPQKTTQPTVPAKVRPALPPK